MDKNSMDFLSRMQGLGEAKFSIKETEFSITKLPPMAGMDLLEYIRAELGHSANSLEVGSGSEEANAALFFKSIICLHPAVVKKVRNQLFQHIEFQGAGVERGWAKLYKLEDTAFQNFEVINIYEVLVRALYVNFSGSFTEIASAFPGAESILRSLKPKT